MMTNNTLIAAAMQSNQTPANAPTHHPTHGQHASFFSGGAQGLAAANSQVGSTNFFNTLQGSRSTNLQGSVQAIPIQIPQTTISSQYPIAAQQAHQASQPIVHPIGAPVGGYASAYGDIGTQPKHHARGIPSGLSMDRQTTPSIHMDLPVDLLSRSDSSGSRSSNLSQHVDAKPFSPNRQMGGGIPAASNKPQEERYGNLVYSNRVSSYNPADQGIGSKPQSYSAAPVSIGHYSVEDRKSYSQPRSSDAQRMLLSDADAPVPSLHPASLTSSLPYSMTSATTAANASQKPNYSQTSKVSQQPPSSSAPQQSTPPKGTSTSSTPPAQPPLPHRGGFNPRTGSNNPRMPPQMFSQANPQMMSMMGMRFAMPFPQGPPPPRGAQFMPPQRMPSSSAGVNLPAGPSPNPQPIIPPAPNTSQSGPKMQKPQLSTSISQSAAPSQAKPTSQSKQSSKQQAASSQGGYQANKNKSLAGLPGPSAKLSKAPSHFAGRRQPVDLKTPEEIKAEQNKERAKLLASTKAFFGKPTGEGADSKEKSDKADN